MTKGTYDVGVVAGVKCKQLSEVALTSADGCPCPSGLAEYLQEMAFPWAISHACGAMRIPQANVIIWVPLPGSSVSQRVPVIVSRLHQRGYTRIPGTEKPPLEKADAGNDWGVTTLSGQTVYDRKK